MKILALPLLSDNYAWLLYDEQTRDCAVIDPSETQPVRRTIDTMGLTLRWILATHHHPDHVDGILGLTDGSTKPVVIASRHDRDRVPGVTQVIDDAETCTVLGRKMRCLGVPGHTLGAVAFYFAEARAVFTGDTLFTGGCGRLFEGTAEQMHQSLNKLMQLPDETSIYCGHEYTEKNMRFALSVEPHSEAVRARLARVADLRSRGAPTVPEKLSVEKLTNPFLRVGADSVREAMGKTKGSDVLAALRAARDQFI